MEELKAIVDETHGWQKKVACHAYNGIGLQRALDGGCDSIEHGLEITDAQIAQMVKQGCCRMELRTSERPQLLATAPDPSYPGAHSAISGAGAAVLAGFFGDNDRITVTSDRGLP